VVTSDERYPTPGQGCPFGPAHVVDVSNPARPAALATMAIAENNPSACSAAGSGTWTSHNPTLTAHLALISWYSGGLQVFGLDDPANPSPLAAARPSGVTPTLRDIQLGTTASMTWSYPVISGGLIYVVDINQGLLVYRYQGLHQDEIESAGFVEGNSNLGSVPSPNPIPAATSTPGATATPIPARPAPSPAADLRPAAAGAALVVVLAAIAAAVAVKRRRAA
jgi:hypothetical protein